MIQLIKKYLNAIVLLILFMLTILIVDLIIRKDNLNSTQVSKIAYGYIIDHCLKETNNVNNVCIGLKLDDPEWYSSVDGDSWYVNASSSDDAYIYGVYLDPVGNRLNAEKINGN